MTLLSLCVPSNFLSAEARAWRWRSGGYTAEIIRCRRGFVAIFAGKAKVVRARSLALAIPILSAAFGAQ